MKKIILAALISISMQTQAIGLNQGLDQSNIVVQAHESFLQGDYRQTLLNIKTGLEQFDRDSLMKKNLLAFYGELLHSGKLKGVEVGWTLPPEIKSFRLSIDRENNNNEVIYFLIFGGNSTEEKEIKSFKVTRYPDTVILDKENNIGRFTEKIDEYDKSPSFYFRTQKTSQAIPAGLYNIEIKTNKGSTLKAWIILDEKMNASTSPNFLKLTDKTVFKSNEPKFKWSDFKSPEYNPKESRDLYFEISKDTTENHWETLWDLWEKDPTITEAHIGHTKSYTANKLPLDNGSYYALVQYKETSRLGQMRLTRKTTQIKDFKIDVKKK